MRISGSWCMYPGSSTSMGSSRTGTGSLPAMKSAGAPSYADCGFAVLSCSSAVRLTCVHAFAQHVNPREGCIACNSCLVLTWVLQMQMLCSMCVHVQSIPTSCWKHTTMHSVAAEAIRLQLAVNDLHGLVLACIQRHVLTPNTLETQTEHRSPL